MIQKHKIRLNSTESVNSVNRDNKVIVELKQSTKPYFFTNNIKEEIYQYEIFKQERDNCTKYRLITTIKPYCSNILFNTVTEIVKEEGSDNAIIVTDEKTADNLDRIDMIRNTEYSQEDIGFDYHPGYDIFNNHLLRNKTFKIVHPITSLSKKSDKKLFNTIRDYIRRSNGEEINFVNRKSIDVLIKNEDGESKHLYDREDLYDVNEAINAYLTEDNGWIGFVNKSTIIAKENDKDVDYNHIINNKESCDFIDMYPDRTLYSFNPKYNVFKHRAEYNWKIYLTYPYQNFYDHELIKDNNGDEHGLNAPLIQQVDYVTGINGQDIILFKTYFKHNLQGGSTINLYFKTAGKDKYEVINNIVISNIGDLNKNNENFFFSTTDTRLLTELDINKKGRIDKERDDNENLIQKYLFRFTNVINGYESEYYIRLFRKLPNLLKSEKITEKNLLDKDNFEEYINQCNDNFDKEIYRLGFSNTIYSDNNTQITFTDGIDINNLLDNRGRPLSELYLTIVKNNAGNKKWYKDTKIDDETEYSHCFSDVSHGFDLYYDKDSEIKEHAKLSDIKTIHTHQQKDDGSSNESSVKMEIGSTGLYYERTDTNMFGWKNLNNENLDIVNDNNTEFVGDIVEFNEITCDEYILCEGQFRFNTYLRDNPQIDKYHYVIDKMNFDDYDAQDFEIVAIGYDEGKSYIKYEGKDDVLENDMFHPEGYYYKAHYPIQLREWGELQQASHFDLKIKSVNKVNIGNKIFAVIKTTLPHRLDVSDTVLLCNDNIENDKIIAMKPTYVFDELTFALGDYMQYKDNEYQTVLSAADIVDILRGEKYPSVVLKIRKYNNEIPYYATKTCGKNRYMWRTLNGVGNKDNVKLQEYPFANGYFYVNQDINFYLKRQDPFGEIGLQWEGRSDTIVPNDIFGNRLTPSNYEYKEEKEATC